MECVNDYKRIIELNKFKLGKLYSERNKLVFLNGDYDELDKEIVECEMLIEFMKDEVRKNG